jgi:hypothetical protein
MPMPTHARASVGQVDSCPIHWSKQQRSQWPPTVLAKQYRTVLQLALAYANTSPNFRLESIDQVDRWPVHWSKQQGSKVHAGPRPGLPDKYSTQPVSPCCLSSAQHTPAPQTDSCPVHWSMTPPVLVSHTGTRLASSSTRLPSFCSASWRGPTPSAVLLLDLGEVDWGSYTVCVCGGGEVGRRGVEELG